MKARSILQANLIAILTLCLNPLFASDASSDLEVPLLEIEMLEDVRNLAHDHSSRASSNSDPSTTAMEMDRSGNDSSTDTPPKPNNPRNDSSTNTPHNPHTAITIDDNDVINDPFFQDFCRNHNNLATHNATTAAFLNQLNRSLNNEWNVKTWVGYLALGAAYGFYGWTDASYMQLSESWAFPDAMLCIMEQATYDKIYGFAYTQQRFTAFTGKLAYGAIGECLEWAGNLAKRYEAKFSKCPKVISPNANVTAVETDTYAKSRLLANTLGLVLSGGSALVDAKLYKRYLTTTYDASPNDITFWPIWLGAGLTLDNFNDVLELIYAGFAMLVSKTGVIPEQHKHLKELFAHAQYHLQISPDSEIENIYAQFTAAGDGTKNININQLQLLTAAGANTELPNRWLRNLATKSIATVFTLANLYNWWVLGNGIMNLNVAKADSTTAASAALGTLNMAIFVPLTFAGMVQMGNGIIDTFAPQSSQLPHANHRSESNAFKRALQILHLPVAFTACAAGAVAATSFSLYFTLYPDAPFTASNSTGDYNLTNASFNLTDNISEYDECAGYYDNDISFFYNQPWYMVQTAAFLVAANSRPVAKALQIMRAAPTKITDSAVSMYNKVRSWCGYEKFATEITAPQMRDTMMAVILTAVAMLKNANDTTVNGLYGDLNVATCANAPC